MNKIQLKYYDKEDILYVLIAEGAEASSVEINPNITAELNEQGGLIGIEILNASSFIRDTVLQSVEGKLPPSEEPSE